MRNECAQRTIERGCARRRSEGPIICSVSNHLGRNLTYGGPTGAAAVPQRLRTRDRRVTINSHNSPRRYPGKAYKAVGKARRGNFVLNRRMPVS